MRDKSKRKPNKWERLRAENARLLRENNDLKFAAQLSDLGLTVEGGASRRPDSGSQALALGSMLDPLEPPTDMLSPLDPREPLVDVEPEGERSVE